VRDGWPLAILLDLDDTIVSLMEGAEPSWHEAAARFAGRVRGLSAEELSRVLRASRNWFWTDAERNRRGRLDPGVARRETVRHAFAELELEDAALCDEIVDAVKDLHEAMMLPFPGAVEALRYLKAQGVRLALVTNGGAEEQRRKVDRNDLDQYFDLIVIEGEFGVGKPDPRIYTYALDQLGVAPQGAWMIGDHLEWEVRVPQRLGMYAIWVDFAGAGLPESSTVRPDRIIHSLRELIED